MVLRGLGQTGSIGAVCSAGKGGGGMALGQEALGELGVSTGHSLGCVPGLGPLGSLEGLSWRCLIHLGCARTQGPLGHHRLLPQHLQPSSITSTQSISMAPVCRGDTGPGGAHSQVWPHVPPTACTGVDRSSLPQVNRLRSEPGCAGPQGQNPRPGQPPPAVPPRVTGQRAGWPPGEPLATASSGHKG